MVSTILGKEPTSPGSGQEPGCRAPAEGDVILHHVAACGLAQPGSLGFAAGSKDAHDLSKG